MRPFPFARLLVAGTEDHPGVLSYAAMLATCAVDGSVAFSGARTTVPELFEIARESRTDLIVVRRPRSAVLIRHLLCLAPCPVLLVPDGYALKDPSVPSDPYGYKDLGPKGRDNLRAFVQGGGRYVGWLDGGVLASALGISGTVYDDGGDAGVSTPGSLFRVRVNDGSPLAAGVGPFAWVLDDARYVLSSGAGAALRLPVPDRVIL